MKRLRSMGAGEASTDEKTSKKTDRESGKVGKVLRGKTFDWCTVTWSAFSLTSEPWRLRGLLTVPSDCQWYTRSCRAGATFDWCTVTWSAFSLTSEPWRLRGLLTVPSDCQWYTRSCRAGASWKSWKSWKSWLDFGAKTTVTALKIQIFEFKI